jgi:hypothetical protein
MSGSRSESLTHNRYVLSSSVIGFVNSHFVSTSGIPLLHGPNGMMQTCGWHGRKSWSLKTLSWNSINEKILLSAAVLSLSFNDCVELPISGNSCLLSWSTGEELSFLG